MASKTAFRVDYSRVWLTEKPLSMTIAPDPSSDHATARPGPPEMGLIEGYYGPPWSSAERHQVLSFLASQGYRFYHYAPKGDRSVRDHWQRPWSDPSATRLGRLAEMTRKMGMRFGLGISPPAQAGLDRPTRRGLARRIEQINAMGIDDLVVLFDDQAGGCTDLAARQAEITHFLAASCQASRIHCCPTYYSDDPLLDRLFGARPKCFLESLGQALDPAIRVYWTGPRVVSSQISVKHINAVTERLGRRPVLWDNYPVNDSPRMIRHLHLRAFTGRSAELASHIAGHAANPALQAHLSCIPLATLAELYRQRDAYRADRAFRAAARACCGRSLAALLEEDLALLDDAGLDGIGPADRRRLRQRYCGIDHPAAREVLAWLDGQYRPEARLAGTDP